MLAEETRQTKCSVWDQRASIAYTRANQITASCARGLPVASWGRSGEERRGEGRGRVGKQTAVCVCVRARSPPPTCSPVLSNPSTPLHVVPLSEVLFEHQRRGPRASKWRCAHTRAHTRTNSGRAGKSNPSEKLENMSQVSRPIGAEKSAQ